MTPHKEKAAPIRSGLLYLEIARSGGDKRLVAAMPHNAT
jgi:hypothetical protein